MIGKWYSALKCTSTPLLTAYLQPQKYRNNHELCPVQVPEWAVLTSLSTPSPQRHILDLNHSAQCQQTYQYRNPVAFQPLKPYSKVFTSYLQFQRNACCIQLNYLFKGLRIYNSLLSLSSWLSAFGFQLFSVPLELPNPFPCHLVIQWFKCTIVTLRMVYASVLPAALDYGFRVIWTIAWYLFDCAS